MDYSAIQRHWDNPAVRAHGDVSEKAAQGFAKEVLDILRPGGDERVLEVGCGEGLVAQLVAPRVGHIDGFDFAAHRVRESQQRVPAGRFWVQSFLDPIVGQYDAVYSFSVLQYAHPEDIDTVIAHCLAAAPLVLHADVPDRALIHRLPGRPFSTVKAAVKPRSPIWPDGSYAHRLAAISRRWASTAEVDLIDAACPYRRHLVFRSSR